MHNHNIALALADARVADLERAATHAAATTAPRSHRRHLRALALLGLAVTAASPPSRRQARSPDPRTTPAAWQTPPSTAHRAPQRQRLPGRTGTANDDRKPPMRRVVRRSLRSYRAVALLLAMTAFAHTRDRVYLAVGGWMATRRPSPHGAAIHERVRSIRLAPAHILRVRCSDTDDGRLAVELRGWQGGRFDVQEGCLARCRERRFLRRGRAGRADPVYDHGHDQLRHRSPGVHCHRAVVCVRHVRG